MTIRLEPFVSVLVLASLAAMISFALAPRLAPLAIAVPAAVLAMTAHPAGVVAAAPLLAAVPATVAWLRRCGRRALLVLGVLLIVGLALALIVFTFNGDLPGLLSDARVAREGEKHSEPLWREYVRYTAFDAWGGGTALRRLSLALILLVVLAWLTRRRGARTGVLSLPAASVAVALVLLAFTPSKWPWHFGALAAMAAVALAAEAERLFRERHEPRWRAIRPILALALVAAIARWSWTAPVEWGPLDLQELSWSSGFNANSFLVLLGVLAAATAISVRVGSKHGGLEASVGRAVTIVSFAAIGLTCTLLIRDAAITRWSPARQNLEALAGRSSCGLAHHLRGRSDVAELLADSKTPVLLEPPVALYFPCSTIPAVENGLVEAPRLVVFQATLWPLQERDGPFAAISDLYGLTRIARGAGGVKVLSVADAIPGFARADASRVGVTAR